MNTATSENNINFITHTILLLRSLLENERNKLSTYNIVFKVANIPTNKSARKHPIIYQKKKEPFDPKITDYQQDVWINARKLFCAVVEDALNKSIETTTNQSYDHQIAISISESGEMCFYVPRYLKSIKAEDKKAAYIQILDNIIKDLPEFNTIPNQTTRLVVGENIPSALDSYNSLIAKYRNQQESPTSEAAVPLLYTNFSYDTAQHGTNQKYNTNTIGGQSGKGSESLENFISYMAGKGDALPRNKKDTANALASFISELQDELPKESKLREVLLSDENIGEVAKRLEIDNDLATDTQNRRAKAKRRSEIDSNIKFLKENEEARKELIELAEKVPFTIALVKAATSEPSDQVIDVDFTGIMETSKKALSELPEALQLFSGNDLENFCSEITTPIKIEMSDYLAQLEPLAALSHVDAVNNGKNGKKGKSPSRGS